MSTVDVAPVIPVIPTAQPEDVEVAVDVLKACLVEVEPPGTIAPGDIILDDGRVEVEEPTNESAELEPTLALASDEWQWRPSASIDDPRTRNLSWGMDSGKFIDPALGQASPGRLFVAFLPREYIERTMLPAINRNLQKRRPRDLVSVDFAEFMRWIALWLAMCCSVKRSQLFKENNFSIPFDRVDGYNRFMAGNRFHDILQCFTFGMDPAPDDKSKTPYDLINGF
ncbi:hypothetical protein BGZ81_007706 [Podila clonocystis]|nr:hypothetical protein BGZ81_007706 [Podila clonocystis]